MNPKGAQDSEIKQEQALLNTLYNQFTDKYGLLNSLGNKQAFEQDSAYPLFCSLEILDEDGNLERKADMFTKRTIPRPRAVTSVDTAVEALAVSSGEKACVDLGYMASLMGGSEKIPQIVKELWGVIFKDPAIGPFDLEGGGTHWYQGWQTADEYLSGNVHKNWRTPAPSLTLCMTRTTGYLMKRNRHRPTEAGSDKRGVQGMDFQGPGVSGNAVPQIQPDIQRNPIPRI